MLPSSSPSSSFNIKLSERNLSSVRVFLYPRIYVCFLLCFACIWRWRFSKVHWPLIGGLLHLVERGGAWAGCGPTQSPPRCTKYNSPPINGQCTNHCIAIYGGRFLCGFNVAIKGLIKSLRQYSYMKECHSCVRIWNKPSSFEVT